MGKPLAKKVLLIGWDAADWKVIWPLIKAGKMPALKKVIDNGVWGNIATLEPPLSPILWTSIATGKRAYDHGILGFTEPGADSNSITPVLSTSRKVKAIWNILNQNGYKSNVVSWWPSHPVERIDGVMVSNFYQQCNVKEIAEWDLPKEAIHPARLYDELKELRIHPLELTLAHLAPFVPDAKNIDTTKDSHLIGVAKILANAASVNNAVTLLLDNEPWDFTAVYFDAIDHFCHLAMKYHPPHRTGVPEDLYERYKHVVTGGYIFHDMMLERQLKLAGDDTTVIILSDHGFHSDHLRPMNLPKEPAAPAHEHNPFGVFIASGPGIKKGQQIYGASIIDITPTILTLFGLPTAKDMEGKVLIDCFEEKPKIQLIDSWESVDGDSGMHDKSDILDAASNKEALDQLIALGYIDKPDENMEVTINFTINENKYYLARAYMDGNKFEEAETILEELVESNPQAIRFRERLVFSLLRLKKFEKTQRTIDKIYEDFSNKVSPEIKVYQAQLYTFTNKFREALALLSELHELYPHSSQIKLELAKIYHAKHEWEHAKKAYDKVLSIDPNNVQAKHGHAISLLRLDNLSEALEELLEVIDLGYYNPQCHYHIGETFYKMGMFNEAAIAFETAVNMAPKMKQARKWLVEIYENQLKDSTKSEHHKSFTEDDEFITVVSGLPRSGTSLMMQMLANGGLESLTDKKREADESNPKGYFEYESVKRLAADNSWLGEARGKSIKIIAQLLPSLNHEYRYKIIFMERNMDEVIKSQQIMINKSAKDSKDYPAHIAATYKKQIDKVNKWINSQPNIELLVVNYNELIENPEEICQKIKNFLQPQSLNVKAMTEAVDKSLYRNRNKF